MRPNFLQRPWCTTSDEAEIVSALFHRLHQEPGQTEPRTLVGYQIHAKRNKRLLVLFTTCLFFIHFKLRRFELTTKIITTIVSLRFVTNEFLRRNLQ